MKTNLLLLLACLFTLSVAGQGQADAFIKEAQDFIVQKKYQEARLSLQDAINDINVLIAQQIAESLPDEINGLTSTDEDQIGAGAMGMFGGGMQITKSYSKPTAAENTAEVVIMANSPMLTSMNMYLTNPSMMGPDYKSVRIGGTQRAILKSNMEDYYDDNGATKKIRSSELQVPLNQTLITLNLRGFATEADELAFAAKLDIENLKTLLGE